MVDFDRLTLTDVSHSFGRRRVLSRITLETAKGEIVGVLGPNGAGKSTLLAILGTLLTPVSGDVRYGSLTVQAGGIALRHRIGLLAHDPQLYPDLTARENLRFFGRLYALSHLDRRIDDALALAGLGGRADERVATFSRGLRQRLALERALLHEPRLLLLDEPFTGLDERSAGALVSRLGDLKRDTLVVVATHDFELADALLDRAVILRKGRAVIMESGAGGWRRAYQSIVDHGAVHPTARA